MLSWNCSRRPVPDRLGGDQVWGQRIQSDRVRARGNKESAAVGSGVALSAGLGTPARARPASGAAHHPDQGKILSAPGAGRLARPTGPSADFYAAVMSFSARVLSAPSSIARPKRSPPSRVESRDHRASSGICDLGAVSGNPAAAVGERASDRSGWRRGARRFGVVAGAGAVREVWAQDEGEVLRPERSHPHLPVREHVSDAGDQRDLPDDRRAAVRQDSGRCVPRGGHPSRRRRDRGGRGSAPGRPC